MVKLHTLMVITPRISWEGIFPLPGIPGSAGIENTKICETLQFISVIDSHIF